MTDQAADPLALPDYVPNGQVALTDRQRWPGLSDLGLSRLHALEHRPDAPSWIHRTGHRLTPAEQAAARTQLSTDNWLDAHLAHARNLMFYRGHPGPLDRLDDFPLISRHDLEDDIAAFVPREADLSRVLHGTSSGSTGAALVVPDDPDELARGFHWLRGLVGAHWQPDSARLAVAQVVYQRQAFTYPSIVPGFGEATMARLNLHPDVWPREKRDSFLRNTNPQLISGHPTSLEQLLDPVLVAVLRPLALVSGAMALSRPLRQALTAAYDCPVLDIYGLHETRPIGVSHDGGPFVVAQRRVRVEVLGHNGQPVRPGDIGEIVVTCGENAFLPLVRYRTGDTGRLVTIDGRPAIADLEGREATVFAAADGSAVPCVELTQLLQAAGVRGWSVEQSVDGTVAATLAGGDNERAAAGLEALLGRPVSLTVVRTLAELGEGKPRRFKRSQSDPI